MVDGQKREDDSLEGVELVLEAGQLFLDLGDLFDQLRGGQQGGPEPDERLDDGDADGDGPRRLQDVCQHQNAPFGEDKGQNMGKAKAGKVVTICDHLHLLVEIELEHESGREPARVPLDRLVQRLGRHPVEGCQVGIDHDRLAPNVDDTTVYRR